jgi:cytochrome c-type biogenesis protein CcmH/NrfF
MYAQVNALMSALSGEAAAIEAQLQVVRDRKIAAGGVSIALIAALSAGYDLIQFSREVSPATLAFWTLPFGVIALSIVLLGLMIAPVRRARNDRLSLF